MNTLQTIWNLQIKHDYFRDGLCHGLSVTPVADTQKLFKRRNLLFKRTGGAMWSLIDFSKQGQASGDVYEFRVQLKNSNLLYITHTRVSMPETAIKLEITSSDDNIIKLPDEKEPIYEKASPGTFMYIKLQLAETTNTVLNPRTEIRLQASEYYWEYIILFRKKDETVRNIQLEEADSRLTFTEPRKPEEYMGKQALKFRSIQKVQCREVYTYKIQVVEFTRHRKRELLNNLPHPEPGVFLETSQDTMQQIVYI